MHLGKVTLVCNTKNSFVIKDVKLLEEIGYKVLLIYSPAYRDPFRFLANRLKEFILSLFYLPQSVALFSWFNDYHTTLPLFIARIFKIPSTLIIGGYDAVANSSMNYGIFLKNNFRQALAKWNYKKTKSIWVVHKSLAEGCSFAEIDSETISGIKVFIPELRTPIIEAPTAYNSSFWKNEQSKIPKTVLTVANISDQRTIRRKGIPLFFKLAERLPNYQFTLAGIAGPIFEPLPNNVILIGKKSKEELKALYGSHMYYFQGSKIEGLPNVLCEAMLCECIPIGNRVFGIPDVIGATGLVFDAGKGLDEVVSFLKSEQKDFAIKARKWVKNQYSLKRRKEQFKKTLTQNN